MDNKCICNMKSHYTFTAVGLWTVSIFNLLKYYEYFCRNYLCNPGNTAAHYLSTQQLGESLNSSSSHIDGSEMARSGLMAGNLSASSDLESLVGSSSGYEMEAPRCLCAGSTGVASQGHYDCRRVIFCLLAQRLPHNSDISSAVNLSQSGMLFMQLQFQNPWQKAVTWAVCWERVLSQEGFSVASCLTTKPTS